MPYQDTVFGGLMKAFPRWRFDKLVERHGADYRVRRLPSWTQFMAIVFCQLSGSRSLREVVGALERFPKSHAHLGLEPVRLVTVRIDSGREITLVSNDLDAPAAEIAALYKQRWQVELFFKRVKQNLKIRHFLGTSENAVRIQIITALIAYLLLRIAQIGTGTGLGLEAISRLVAKTTFQRRALTDVFEPPPDTPKPHDQLQILFAKI